MPDLVRIYHPQPQRPVTAGALAAHGSAAPGVGAVVALLIGSSRVYVAETLREPPHWVVFFEDVAHGRYRLLITDYWEGTILATLEDLNVRPKTAVGILFPPAPADVCADNFVTYGHTDEDFSVRATLTIGADVYTADQIKGPPDSPDWVIQFTNLPTGDDATLEVVNTNEPPSVEARTPLRVVDCSEAGDGCEPPPPERA